MKHVKGFSLLELLVVVAIVGTLAAAGVIGYTNYTRQAKIETGAYNMNTVFRYMLNVRQQIPLGNALGGDCEIKSGGSCITVNSNVNDFLNAFESKVTNQFGFENPIHPECPITMVYFTTLKAASTVEAQLDNMTKPHSLLSNCVEQAATASAPEYIDGAIYFKLIPNPYGPDLEYFEASMFMPCDSLYTPDSLCQ